MLARRTPLKRFPLSPGASKLPRTPIRKVSAKRRKLALARKACIAAVRERSHGQCQWPGCVRTGAHCHEILPRSAGGSITDPDNCAWLCIDHHGLCHSRPHLASYLGLKVSRYPGRQVPA